ncbi:MAG: DUF5591 domain-containing protein, partial [Methanothrix sp.]|nr:DUF5591 domain-containing protein [Methanothrix sp.]
MPRELEEVYPASSYDVPVTGHWDLEERAWLISCLEEYLERNRYSRVVAHVEGELEETLRDSGIDAVYTGGGTGRPALERLSEAVREACAGVPRVPEPRLQRFSALADYYFGKGAGELLSMGGVRIRGRELQDAGGHVLASLTPNGTLALSLEG